MKINLLEHGVDDTLCEIRELLKSALKCRKKSDKDKYIHETIGLANALFMCINVEEDEEDVEENCGEYDRYNPHYPNK